MFDAAILAGNIKKYRIQRGMSQQELADRLHISAQSVSKWECAQSVPDIGNLYTLAQILRVSVDVLMGRVESGDRLFIGVDGGGTKTEFVLFHENGRIFNRIVLGGSNPNVCGTQGCCNVLKAGLDKLLGLGMEVRGVFIGCAGMGGGNHAQVVKAALKKEYPNLTLECGSDIRNIIACSDSREKCIATICGTGSVVYANENGNLHRLGGAGYLLEKKGSGYDIGRDVLYAALQDRDGTGEKTLLTDMVEQRLGTTVWECIQELYKKEPAFIASFAPMAFQVFRAGDRVAGDILEENVARLALLINTAAERYDCGEKVLLSGSVASKEELFVKMLQHHLTPGLQPEVLHRPPVFGACRLACEICGVETGELTDHFELQYKLYL